MRLAVDSDLSAQLDDDSTSAQYGDISSQHSPVEAAADNPETEAIGDLSPLSIPIDKPKSSQSSHRREWPDSSKYLRRNEQTASQETMVQIWDVEDGGYDGDAEVHYPDGYEEAESAADESEVSRLTMEESNDHDALMTKLGKLTVKEKKRRSMAQRRRSVVHPNPHPSHKRTHSESLDDLSEDNNNNHNADNDEASSPPAQKRPRNQSNFSSREEPVVNEDVEMDIG